MGKTTYNSKWEEEYSWISRVAGGDSTKAHCKLCKKSFLVNSSGVAQVKSHARSELHQREEKSFANQAVFSNNGKLSCKFSLTKEEEVVKAETLHTLHFVDKNYSYSSSTQMSELYRIMFPDSAICKIFYWWGNKNKLPCETWSYPVFRSTTQTKIIYLVSRLLLNSMRQQQNR